MQNSPKLSFGGYWRTTASQMRNLASLAGAGLLAAVSALLKGLFTIPLGSLSRISFSFLGTAVSGFLYGPVVSGFAGMVVDVIGYLLRPDGPYFFGFTFNMFVSGFLYGCWLYRRPVRLWRTFAACLTSIVVVSFLLNPLWLNLLYGDAFWALVWMRVPKNIILLPINTALLYPILRVVDKQKHHLARGQAV